MANTRTLDLIDDKTGTAEELLAAVRRASQTDFPDWRDALDACTKAASTVDSLLHSLVSAARQDGASWDQIGDMLGGVSRQAAHERFSK